MKVLFLHGWTSVPGGVKPTFLRDHGHEVFNPALPDEDFEDSIAIAESIFAQHHPEVIVGSSRGGAIAVNMISEQTPLVLMCPAWRNWGSANRTKPNTTILHSRLDDVIPFNDSELLLANSGLNVGRLIETGCDHRLATPDALAEMLLACESVAQQAR